MRGLTLLLLLVASDCIAAVDCRQQFLGDWEVDLVQPARPDENVTADNWHHVLYHFEDDGSYNGSVAKGDDIASLDGEWNCTDGKLEFSNPRSPATIPSPGPRLEVREVREDRIVLFDPGTKDRIFFHKSDWSHPAPKPEAPPPLPPPEPKNDREREALALMECHSYAAMGLILGENDTGDRNRFGLAAKELAGVEFLRQHIDAVTHRASDEMFAAAKGPDGAARFREIEKACLARLAKLPH